MKTETVKLGKVSITCNGQWSNKEYDRLCIVHDGRFASYISKKQVPKDISLTNEEYWQPLSSLREDLTIDYETFKKEILEGFVNIQTKILSSRIVVANKEERDNLIFGQVVPGCEVYELDTNNSYILTEINPDNNIKSWISSNLNSNSIYLPFKGSKENTRTSIPNELRHKGLVITYILDNEDKTIITERYTHNTVVNDDVIVLDSSWSPINEVNITGNVSISDNGTWIVNGQDTNINARGPKGDNGFTPLLRVNNNKFEVSYDGIIWNVVSDYISGWFKWNKSNNSDSIGKIQVSYDLGNTWLDLSPEFTNNIRIKDYVTSVSKLPSSAIQGDIYGVGPIYEDDDINHENPKYYIYVKTSSGWINNGKMSSLIVGVVQTTGQSTTNVMSQKAVSDAIAAATPENYSEVKEKALNSIQNSDIVQVTGTACDKIMSQNALTKLLGLIETGTFADALKLSLNKTTPFAFILMEDEIQKPIWHIGNSVFIDAVGAEISLPYNDWEVYNFTYKVILQEDNETVYVPVVSYGGTYNMRVDWGDGTIDTYNGVGYNKSCYHQYSGNAGDIFEIVLSGDVLHLDFSVSSRGGQKTLYEIVNNTLKNKFTLLGFLDCSNLRKIASNTFNNAKPFTSLSFAKTQLEEIENNILVNLDKSAITEVSFAQSNIRRLSDNFFNGMNLTDINSIFKETPIEAIPSSLKSAIRQVNNLFYAFHNLKAEVLIPSDLFDEIEVAVTDARQCFSGKYDSFSKAKGDAKALYDRLSSIFSGTQYENCFIYTTMDNLNLVPISWGGNLK